jgi:hypothetical protein
MESKWDELKAAFSNFIDSLKNNDDQNINSKIFVI